MEDIQHQNREEWRIYSIKTGKSGGYTAHRQRIVEDIKHIDREEWRIYSTKARKNWGYTAHRQGRVEDIQHQNREESRIYNKSNQTFWAYPAKANFWVDLSQPLQLSYYITMSKSLTKHPEVLKEKISGKLSKYL